MANSLKIALAGKVVVLSKRYYKGDERERRFLCADGLGCRPRAQGTVIVGFFLTDGRTARVESHQVEKLSDDQSRRIGHTQPPQAAQKEKTMGFRIKVQGMATGVEIAAEQLLRSKEPKLVPGTPQWDKKYQAMENKLYKLVDKYVVDGGTVVGGTSDDVFLDFDLESGNVMVVPAAQAVKDEKNAERMKQKAIDAKAKAEKAAAAKEEKAKLKEAARIAKLPKPAEGINDLGSDSGTNYAEDSPTASVSV